MAFLPSRGVCRLLPALAVASVALPWAGGEFAKNFHPGSLGTDPRFVDIVVIAVIIFALTMVATAAVGCWVVRVMQGPQHRGDAFPAERDSDPKRPE